MAVHNEITVPWHMTPTTNAPARNANVEAYINPDPNPNPNPNH